MHLIGINGFKTSGKDTTYAIVKALVEGPSLVNSRMVEPSERVERRAFADNLKIMAMLALGVSGSDEFLIRQADLFKEGGIIECLIPMDGQIRSFTERRATGRQYLQDFGANGRKVFGDAFWVDQVLPCPTDKETAYSNPRAVMEANGDFDPIWGTLGRKGERVGLPAVGCVTDVRYPNEAERTRECGGVTLEIVRPGIDTDGHATEQPLPRHLVDYTIVNDGSLLDLQAKVTEFLKWKEIL